MAAAIMEDESQGTALLQQICQTYQRATGDGWNATKESEHAGDKLFALRDGLVYRLRGGNEVTLVVPDIEDLHSDLLTMHHDSPMAGHLGLYRMMWALAKCYWWKGMYHDC